MKKINDDINSKKNDMIRRISVKGIGIQMKHVDRKQLEKEK
jgi:hypothetical protein